MSKPMDLGALKICSYIIVDGEPCRIVSYDHSKPGKHGSAKARITAVGVFDGRPHPFVGPVSTKVDVPLIDKRNGQIISKQGEVLMIQDLETFETFETTAVDDEIKERLQGDVNGREVEYWKVLDRIKIVRVKG
jgi:translation initiation factor 5A